MSMSPPPPPPPPPPDSVSHDRAPGGAEIPSAALRIVARLLDGIIVGVVFGLIFSSILLDSDDTAGTLGLGADGDVGQLYLLGLLGMAVGFVWDAVCTKQFGGTPMKLAFGMRVVQAGTGAPVEWSHAIKRWALPGAFAIASIGLLGTLVGIANLIVVIISLVYLFTKPLRRTLWDQFGGTVVVKR